MALHAVDAEDTTCQTWTSIGYCSRRPGDLPTGPTNRTYQQDLPTGPTNRTNQQDAVPRIHKLYCVGFLRVGGAGPLKIYSRLDHKSPKSRIWYWNASGVSSYPFSKTLIKTSARTVYLGISELISVSHRKVPPHLWVHIPLLPLYWLRIAFSSWLHWLFHLSSDVSRPAQLYFKFSIALQFLTSPRSDLYNLPTRPELRPGERDPAWPALTPSAHSQI